MATYVNDLRLKEIGTGESSGTWGTETNTNLELIGEALGFGTEAITTNADTHTTTVAYVYQIYWYIRFCLYDYNCTEHHEQDALY
jgi:hypothetical protein